MTQEIVAALPADEEIRRLKYELSYLSSVCQKLEKHRDVLLEELAERGRTVRDANNEVIGVWHWQGDEYDHPESLTCPILISPEKMRDLLKLIPGGRKLKKSPRHLLEAFPLYLDREGRLPCWPYCIDCKRPFEFDRLEPFAFCGCGTTEWSRPRPADYVLPPLQRVEKSMPSGTDGVETLWWIDGLCYRRVGADFICCSGSVGDRGPSGPDEKTE